MDLSEELSEHFTLAEGVVTRHADVDNTPPPTVIANMRIAAQGLELVRALLGYAIITVSWFRCWSLNRLVGGSRTSDHPNGWAIDFICPRFGTPLQICHAIVKSGIRFDQLIEEGTWVHISFAPEMRMMVLTKAPHGDGYVAGLREAA